jgi:hypothetical protein
MIETIKARRGGLPEFQKILPSCQVKQPTGEKISLKNGCRDVLLKGESMQHPTSFAQNLLDIQNSVSYIAPN